MYLTGADRREAERARHIAAEKEWYTEMPKALRQAARDLLAEVGEGYAFGPLAVRIRELAAARLGVEPGRIDRWRADEALKGQCGIGRCHGCGGAFFWKRGAGRTLDTVKCTACGQGLAQTSLAYQRVFRLVKP